MMFLFFEFNIWYYGIDLIESESFFHLDGDLLLFPFLDFLAGITEGDPFRVSSGQDTDELPAAFEEHRHRRADGLPVLLFHLERLVQTGG